MTFNDNQIKDSGHGPLVRQQGPGNSALRKGRASLPGHVYFVTSTTLERRRFFVDFKAGCAAARCFEDSAVLGDANMLSWVLMPDHAHWLVQLGKKHTLDLVINRIKSSSARSANRVLGRRGKLWQAAYYDHAVREEEDLRNLARYIVLNPKRADIVERIHDYPFWNAVWV